MKPDLQYFAKEDPWLDDDDDHHGRPVILARLGGEPGSEARWSESRQEWQPFPDMLQRLSGGDWWDRTDEERARHYFGDAALEGTVIQPAPEPRPA